MEIMLAAEKRREDLLYDMWLQDMALMSGDEPEYGYDGRGWFSTLTQQEDGADDLRYLNSLAMNVSTEDHKSDDSNRWLDMAGNVALLIFAPDLYLVNQMNESSQYSQYHAMENKEEDDQGNAEQKEGWFKKLFNRRKGNEEVKTS